MNLRSKTSDGEVVLLLHGLGRTCGCFRRLRRRLEAEGYRTVGWNYPSLRQGVAALGRRLQETLVSLDEDPAVGQVHLVTHSLGGIVVRQALTLGIPGKLGRIVMLAPPNRGSAAARRLAPLLGWLAVPLRELSDDPTSTVNGLSPIVNGVRVGVIAGARDGRVPVANSHVAGEADHIVVPGGHTFIMNRPAVARQVVEFLAAGRFLHPTL